MNSRSPMNPLPRGISRFFFRFPILLYHWGLGWLFGKRFLLLTHTGRKSGLSRQTVIEVVRIDNGSRTYFAASGWGERADWYQNIIAHPQVTIQVGNKSMPANARRLAPDEAQAELLDYAHRHPTAWRELARFMGYPPGDSAAEIHLVAQTLPVLAFEVREGAV